MLTLIGPRGMNNIFLYKMGDRSSVKNGQNSFYCTRLGLAIGNDFVTTTLTWVNCVGFPWVLLPNPRPARALQQTGESFMTVLRATAWENGLKGLTISTLFVTAVMISWGATLNVLHLLNKRLSTGLFSWLVSKSTSILSSHPLTVPLVSLPGWCSALRA